MGESRERDLQRNMLDGKARKEPGSAAMLGRTTMGYPNLQPQFVMFLLEAKVGGGRVGSQQNGCLVR